MLSKIFYKIKPLISRKMQFSLRRLLIRSKLEKYRHVWPIDEKASVKPAWFTGWPEGKRFAFLVTHDVEHSGGLAKIGKLIEADEKFGIASSFGLVPQRYAVSEEVLALLRSHNREVYVHDLNHDGKLFSKYSVFHKRAREINRYLRMWNAEGFRAGSMHHNMDWIGELDIKYDMSTFDTDPFEPMPDGVETIFPFVATSTSTNRAYVEIPYTLPQDLMTLVLHPARSIDIWKEKLEWIARKGGMVSVNVHPDYMAFSEEERSFDNYDAVKYEEFLEHVVTTYGKELWNPDPSTLSKMIYQAEKRNSPGLL